MRIAALILICALAASNAAAAEFFVLVPTDEVDADPGDGVCSAPRGGGCTLRAAVMEAEANDEADTIIVQPGLRIELTLAGDGGTEVGALDIDSDIEILGYTGDPPINSALLPQIDASAISDRHFYVLGERVVVRGLRLVNGSAVAGGAFLIGASADVRIENSLFANNSAESRGGAIVVLAGTVRIEDSQFFRNDSGTAGGAAVAVQNGHTVIRASSFLDNRDGDTFGSTVAVLSNGRLVLESSTLDGTLFRPPIPGLEAATGIVAFSPEQLDVRNTTITNFQDTALEMRNLDGSERIRVANSVLQSGGTACVANGSDLAGADVEIGFSIIEHESDCSDFFRFGVQQAVADLLPLTDDAPPRITVSRRPTGIESNLVETGPELDFVPGGPDFACTTSDQLGAPRPIDANLDEVPRCDLGAIEQAPPEPFVVNYFVEDRADDLPGDGECATTDFGAGPVCTLRAAVMEANALPGLQHIVFEDSADPAVLTLPAVGPIGGALEVTDTLAIDGNLENGRPATAIEGQMAGERLFFVDAPNRNVYFRNLRMTGGDAVGAAGGAIVLFDFDDVTVDRSEFSENFADAGGAIAALGGELTVRNSDFDANEADTRGQAVFGNGVADIELAASSARNHSGFDAMGNPIAAVDVDAGVELIVTNSTFSANQLAFLVLDPARFSMFQSTLFGNVTGALNLALSAGSEVLLANNILAAPDGGTDDCIVSQTGMPASVQVLGLLDSDGSCVAAFGAGQTDDTGLRPLIRAPGRISFHHPLRVEASSPSPAIDAGNLFLCQLAFDQVGAPRPVDLEQVPDVDGPCDLGSIEAQVFDQLFDDSFETASQRAP